MAAIMPRHDRSTDHRVLQQQGRVGTTSLAYHLAWMFAERGHRVLAADLDPQANLSAAFLGDDRLEELWSDTGSRLTLAGPLTPLLEGTGALGTVYVRGITDRLGLVVGDLSLSALEDELSSQWPACLDQKPHAFRIVSAIWHLIMAAAREREDDLVLLDVGPNLGALNRSALIASDHVVIPLAPDVFSFQGLRNVGPALRHWRLEWGKRLEVNPEDPECLAMLKQHHSFLIPLGRESRKPIFALEPADGAFDAYQRAVTIAFDDFSNLAERIEDGSNLTKSGSL